MSQFLLKRKRDAFSKAFDQGLGMSKADKGFISFTEKSPGVKAILAVLLSFVVSGVVFGLLWKEERYSALVFRILVFGMLLALFTSFMFLVPILLSTASIRLERASEVAKCFGSKKTIDQCDEIVRSAHAKAAKKA